MGTIDRNMLVTPPGFGELWMGGRPSHESDDGLLDFDLIVNASIELPWLEPHGAGVYIRLPIDDAHDTFDDEGTAERVRAVSSLVAGALTMGWKVLVHCNMGLNRSGVTCARALMYMGSTAPDAIANVRENRFSNRREWWASMALFNVDFVRWLEREDGINMPTADTTMMVAE